MLFHLQVSLGTQHQLESLMTRLVHLLGSNNEPALCPSLAWPGLADHGHLVCHNEYMVVLLGHQAQPNYHRQVTGQNSNEL